jgi:hypothetical protein
MNLLGGSMFFFYLFTGDVCIKSITVNYASYTEVPYIEFCQCPSEGSRYVCRFMQTLNKMAL